MVLKDYIQYFCFFIKLICIRVQVCVCTHHNMGMEVSTTGSRFSLFHMVVSTLLTESSSHWPVLFCVTGLHTVQAKFKFSM